MATEPVESKHCRQCGEYKPATAEFFVPGTKGKLTKLCRACRTCNESERRTAANNPPLDMSGFKKAAKKAAKPGAKPKSVFSQRNVFNDAILDKLEQQLVKAESEIQFNEYLRQQAIENNNANQIDKANRACQKANAEYNKVLLALNERYQLGDELRLKAEKMKPPVLNIIQMPELIPTVIPVWEEPELEV